MRGLFRPKNDRILAGVLVGIATFFGLNRFYVRVGFIIVTIFSMGTCMILYLLACLIIPNEREVH